MSKKIKLTIDGRVVKFRSCPTTLLSKIKNFVEQLKQNKDENKSNDK
jgi:hypothetical protein